MDHAQRRRYGIVLVASSAVLWSTAGLFVRMAGVDAWTMVFWQSIFSGLTLGIIAVARNPGHVVRRLGAAGAPGAVYVAVSVLSTISYVTALRLTTVANVMTVYASLPFIATAIAFAWTGERVTTRFLIAGTFAVAGIAVTAAAVATSHDLWGIVAALVTTACFATQLVHTKRHPSLDMTLLVALSAAACAPLSIPFMPLAVPAPSQLLACALYGVVTNGLGIIVALEGGRLISSGEAGLISMLDVVLGPLWVWLAFAERPSIAAMVGGFMVLAAVGWYLSTSRWVVKPA